MRFCQRHLGAQWITIVTKNLLNVHGLERLPELDPDKSYICASNHRSFFDLYVVTAYLVRRGMPHRLVFPVRSDFFYDHPLGLFVNGVMSFLAMYPPIFRDRPRAALNLVGLDELAWMLQRGGTFLGIHPEGTRKKDDDPYTLLPAQPGVGQAHSPLARDRHSRLRERALERSPEAGDEQLRRHRNPGPYRVRQTDRVRRAPRGARFAASLPRHRRAHVRRHRGARTRREPGLKHPLGSQPNLSGSERVGRRGPMPRAPGESLTAHNQGLTVTTADRCRPRTERNPTHAAKAATSPTVACPTSSATRSERAPSRSAAQPAATANAATPSGTTRRAREARRARRRLDQPRSELRRPRRRAPRAWR